MNTILGIDAGGTFTDCVIVNAVDRHVLHKAKTLTTKDDLTLCLEASFAGLPARLVPEISLVCLSTTLATNAIVEGHGCREGLILIGSKPAGKLPTSRYVLVHGKHDIKGRLVENIDPDQVNNAVESFRHEVDAMAVSGYASVRCPEHELFVRAVVEERLGVPVVCAHELTSKLGYYDRTITTVLNARLIPMVCALMDSVKSVMARHGIAAPLMMVRGDGTLMTDAQARNKPIETILSGPAASAIGAVQLSGRSDCFVMDIGGTTTDIANVSAGRLAVRSEGAKVGGWSAHVRAAEVFTVGLGGDSRIHLDGGGQLRIGPDKSVSYSMAAARYPHLVDELECIWAERGQLRFRFTDQEAYALVEGHDEFALSGEENTLVEALRHRPRTLYGLGRAVKLRGLRSILSGLVARGVVERISLTPTDLWNVTGQYTLGDSRAAELAVRIAAEQLGTSNQGFITHVQRMLREQLDIAAIRAAMYVDHQDLDIDEGGPADYFLNRLCFEPASRTLRASYHLLKPVVAIGAPAETWLSGASAESLFDAEVPEHAEVANALGAAVAPVIEKVEVLIRHDTVSDQYLVFSPMERAARGTLDEATAYAKQSAEDFIARPAGDAGYRLDTQVDDFEIVGLGQGEGVFIERVVTLSAQLNR